MSGPFTFLEFFAGGGMARLGLGDSWRCAFANDFDAQKCASYRANFGDEIMEGDIAAISAGDLPQKRVDLAWGSFPCQDLSLAGARGGIKAQRSSAFFQFWRLIDALTQNGRAPNLIVLENVVGLLTSNNGRDFEAVCQCLASAGYRMTALIADAKAFTPQSRPRLFILGFGPEARPLEEPTVNSLIAPQTLITAHDNLPASLKKMWVWSDASLPKGRNTRLSDIIDWDAPQWHSQEQTHQLLSMMSKAQRERLDAIARNGARRAGAAFRRTRIENGATIQRLEARFDGVAGCLRTPAGGSSRQIIIAVENGKTRTRLMTPREAARLMGLPEDYILPESSTAALKLCGDGVCVPVVRWLSETVLTPALVRNRAAAAA